MLEFITNYGGSIIVGLIVLAIIAIIIVSGIRDKRAGKHSCGGNCSACGCCSSGKGAAGDSVPRTPVSKTR